VTAIELPALVDRAARTLAEARTHAEILDAKRQAGDAYDSAKRLGRMARIKDAHSEIIDRIRRSQADALAIEAAADERLAVEYDAAQERGEIRGSRERTTSKPEAVGAADLGLSHKDIYEARQIRDAEKAEPGIVGRTLTELVQAGHEPTRAALRQAVVEAAARGGKERAPSHKNPEYVDDPAYKAMARLTGACRTIIDLRAETPVETVFAGFLDAGMRTRNLRTIRTCRDLLTELLEYTDECQRENETAQRMGQGDGP
jgi:hypothetical protein